MKLSVLKKRISFWKRIYKAKVKVSKARATFRSCGANFIDGTFKKSDKIAVKMYNDLKEKLEIAEAELRIQKFHYNSFCYWN